MDDVVIVAVNGGPGSTAALAWALQWTRHTEQPLLVCTIFDAELFQPSAVEPGRDEVLRRARADVERLDPSARPEYRVLFGRPRDVLVDLSEDAAMIVLGAHEDEPVIGPFHGTLPLRVADRASCTVVVVPSDWSGRRGNVVVGVDYETDDEAIRFGVLAARASGAPLELVHGWQAVGYAAGGYYSWFETTEPIIEDAENDLREIAEPIRRAHPDLPLTTLAAEGRGADVLLDRAEFAELLVVGTHRRMAVVGMMLGSVSHDLIVNLPCPVAVVPTPTRRKRRDTRATAADAGESTASPEGAPAAG